MVIKCPKCSRYVSDTTTVCQHCGAVLKEGAPEQKQEPVSVPQEEKPAPVAPPPSPAPVAPPPVAYQQAEKSNVTLYAVIAVLALLICGVGGYLYYVNVYGRIVDKYNGTEYERNADGTIKPKYP